MNPTPVLSPHQQAADPVVSFIEKLRERIATVVLGQDVVVERLLIALFTGGHLLLQGVPGLAMTLLVSVLSKSIDLKFARSLRLARGLVCQPKEITWQTTLESQLFAK